MPPEIPSFLRISTNASENSLSFEDLKGKIDALDTSTKITQGLLIGALLLIVIELLGIVVDLYKDRSVYEQTINQNSIMQERIMELEHQIMSYRKEIIEKEIVLECLKIKKYWEFPDCFNR